MRALLIARGGGIGDTFLATVVARALRSRYAAVDMLVHPAHRPVVRGNPDIDSLVDASQASLLRGRYGAAIVTWATLENAVLPLRARIGSRVGQAHRLYSPLFTHRVTVRSERGDRTTHWTQILLDYARALECDTSDAQPRINLDATDREEASRVLATARVSGAYGLLHPTRGVSSARERWPSEMPARLANALVERYGLPLLVTGAREDRAYNERLFASARTATRAFEAARRAPAINLAGTTSLRGFAALAQGARYVVAMDSGPMHLAAATGTPTAGIFALRSDEPDRWAPLGARTALVRGTYPCPAAHRKETCPDFACVRELEPARVLAALDGLLGRA